MTMEQGGRGGGHKGGRGSVVEGVLVRANDPPRNGMQGSLAAFMCSRSCFLKENECGRGGH